MEGQLRMPAFNASLLVSFLLFSSAITLISKTVLDEQSIGVNGSQMNFASPVFLSLAMFTGMATVLILHFVVAGLGLRFPGYESGSGMENFAKNWSYFRLLLPTFFGAVSRVLYLLGLLNVYASTFQIVKGSVVIFIAVLHEFVVKRHIFNFQWIGIQWVVLSLLVVSVAAILAADSSGTSTASDEPTSAKVFASLIYILFGAFMQSLQYVHEEHIMRSDDTISSVPPLFLVGIEGVWGIALCVLVLYPTAYFAYGQDHGSLENWENTLFMLSHSTRIQWLVTLYIVFSGVSSVLGSMVTYHLSSQQHAVVNNLRPMVVWAASLLLFYCVSYGYGEPWTAYSWLQATGLLALLYGTAIYNAPRPGSWLLRGRWCDCFLDCSEEYAARRQVEQAGGDPSSSEVVCQRTHIATTTYSKAYLGVMPFLLRRHSEVDRHTHTLLSQCVEDGTLSVPPGAAGKLKVVKSVEVTPLSQTAEEAEVKMYGSV